MQFTEDRRKLFVSEKAIEKKGIEFFKNLKVYEINHGDFGFDIDGYYDERGHYAGAGVIKNRDYYFYDNSQDEKVVFVKEIVRHVPLWK